MTVKHSAPSEAMVFETYIRGFDTLKKLLSNLFLKIQNLMLNNRKRSDVPVDISKESAIAIRYRL